MLLGHTIVVAKYFARITVVFAVHIYIYIYGSIVADLGSVSVRKIIIAFGETRNGALKNATEGTKFKISFPIAVIKRMKILLMVDGYNVDELLKSC